MRPKIVFIAHPIGGNVEGNIASVLEICKEVHTADLIPFAPYLVALQYLNDAVAEDRVLGTTANHEYFHRGVIDELWLYGSYISSGMEDEIALALYKAIPIVAKTEGTKRDLAALLQRILQRKSP